MRTKGKSHDKKNRSTALCSNDFRGTNRSSKVTSPRVAGDLIPGLKLRGRFGKTPTLQSPEKLRMKGISSEPRATVCGVVSLLVLQTETMLNTNAFPLSAPRLAGEQRRHRVSWHSRFSNHFISVRGTTSAKLSVGVYTDWPDGKKFFSTLTSSESLPPQRLDSILFWSHVFPLPTDQFIPFMASSSTES